MTRRGPWGHCLFSIVRMHAVGSRARLPAARWLRAQAKAKARAKPQATLQAVCDGLLRSTAVRAPFGAWLSNRQTRCFSSKPNGSASPDNHEADENNNHAADEDDKHEVDEVEKQKVKDEHINPSAKAETKESISETSGGQLSQNEANSNVPEEDNLPPVNLPQWFLDEQVCTLNSDRISSDSLCESVWRHFPPECAESSPGKGSASISVSDEGKVQSSPERAIGRELLSTLSAELDARPPSTRAAKEPERRPISLFYVHNYKGRQLPGSIIGQVAAELAADVIHLDATRLARIVAPYMGSTLYSGRDSMSMLGYTVAEANGRLPPSSSTTDGEDGDTAKGMTVMVLMTGEKDSANSEDPELNRVLKEIVNSASAKRKSSGVEPSQSERLIVHVHNYVELAMTTEGLSILDKLRAIVDRLWKEGSSAVLVGSASNDKNASKQWHSKVKELSQSDCYPIVLHPNVDDVPELISWEKEDNVQDNLNNINWMLECLQSQPLRVLLPPNGPNSEAGDAVDQLKKHLSTRLFSNHWIYRLCTQALGLDRNSNTRLDASTLAKALKQMAKVDEARSTILGGGAESSARPAKLATSPIENLISLGNNMGSLGDRSTPGRRRTHSPPNLNDEEKKLLSGLVDVDDTHITFDDVVAPDDIRESLLSLITLSLQHPKAFSYGVLARERIHGCLLYGPPGTGKTMMAKAVAKCSKASMLEISAASINDMWVGNSEKNVRAVFSLARKMSPMVVFLDEADALLGSRGRHPNSGGYRETINQFLREWDGLTNALNTQQIFIMVSTNRPQDLDEAVLRRLPRRILVDLPLQEARLAILQSLLRDEVLASSVSISQLATDTELYSGSDLKNLAVAAAMEAAKEELAAAKAPHRPPALPETLDFPAKRTLTKAHFDKALRDISASISEDMHSLKAIRKFDEKYGDARRKKRRNGIGFQVVPQLPRSEDSRVRNQ